MPSYICAQETGLYYLQSRYYNPEWGRFLNADTFVSTGQGLLGNNMFAYCRNNPVRRVDISGAADADCLRDDGELLSSDEIEGRQGGDVGGQSGNPLPQQGPVSKNPHAPPVDAGKQGKHVLGHNNYDPNKSSWPEGETGVEQTQEAWLNGVPDYRKPGQNVRIGISSDGTIVRVHMGANGMIHGYPFYPHCAS